MNHEAPSSVSSFPAQRAGNLPDVAVVVLNWRRYPDTAACLASLRLPQPPRTYLVDHQSDPQSLAALLETSPDIIPLPQPDNPGFPEGMNRGMARALADGATYVLLLNNDARVTPTAIERLRAVFDTHPDAGIVGAAIRFPEPDGRLQSLGIDVNRVTGRIRLRGHGTRPPGPRPALRPETSPDPVEPGSPAGDPMATADLPTYHVDTTDLAAAHPLPVDAVSGAAMMISRKLLETIGFFDPAWFFYFEDVDLCLRARARGFGVYIEPAALVYHVGGATIGQAPRQVYYGVRNQLEVVHRHGLPLPRALALARAGFVVGLNLGRLLVGAPVSLRSGLPWLGRGVRDYRAGRLGPHRGSSGDDG